MASSSTFTLSTPSGTDIWRKPPTTNAFNAPTHPSTLTKKSLTSFQSARITFTLPPPSQLRQYDQAGLLLHFTPKSGSGQDRWLKTGVEFYNGAPYVSTVGCDHYADWSVVPHSSGSPSAANADTPIKATLEAKRQPDELGTGLWVYQLAEEGKTEVRKPLREVCWVFEGEENWDVGVGGYVARPNKEGEGQLSVEFGGLEIAFA